MTQVSEVMTRGVRSMARNDTLIMAAQAMDELNVGVIPVCEGEQLIGMVTDRDIVVRGVAQGLPIEEAQLDDVMSENVRYCFEDQSLEDVLAQMRDSQIRRMPVVDHQQHLVGMVSLGDVAVKDDQQQASQTLQAVSEPAEPDRSGQSQASGAAGGGSASNEARGSTSSPQH